MAECLCYNESMQPHDLRNQLKKYASKWIILSRDYKKVLLSGRTLNALLKTGRKEKIGQGYIMKVAKDYSNYIGNV